MKSHRYNEIGKFRDNEGMLSSEDNRFEYASVASVASVGHGSGGGECVLPIFFLE